MKFLKSNKSFNFHKAFDSKMSLRNRLWLFQIVMVLIILVCIFTIAHSSGIIGSLSENPYSAVYNELKGSEDELSEKCLVIMNSVVELSKKVDKSIQKQLESRNLEPGQLESRPDLLEDLLASEIEKSCFAMEKAGATGVFVFLDATVNPSLKQSRNSKSGFFIVNMNPNPTPYESQKLFLLYGPAKLARENNMYLHTQWEMEMDLSLSTFKRRTDIYKKPFEAAVLNKGEEINNIGYWNPLFLPADNAEMVVSYSVPLLDKYGNPYGVCGLEMSKTAFENMLINHSPEFEKEILLFSTQIGIGINMRNALICGTNTSWLNNGDPEFLYISSGPGGEVIPQKERKLNRFYFNSPEEKNILGLSVNARIYPGKSVFKDEKWALTLLLPESVVSSKTARLYYTIAELLLLFIGSIFITLFTSKFCISPILDAIKKLKENEKKVKTNITEIDNLIDFLLKQPDTYNNEEISSASLIKDKEEELLLRRSIPAVLNVNEEQYKMFRERLSTLSNAERKIFDLYMQGYDAKEICSRLFISINTLKTHNRRIYTKMNVCSRAELLKYCSELIDKA